MSRRILVVIAALALLAGLPGCGNKQNATLKGETEGAYIDLGQLKYQVQISRQLNPADGEDKEFLTGVASKLGAQDVWFGVFVRVENESSSFQTPASAYEIHDTQDHVYTPALIDPTNLYSYKPVRIPGNGVLPNVSQTAAQNSINGELLLFRIPRASLDNRPLELMIHNPDDAKSIGTINLDV